MKLFRKCLPAIFSTLALIPCASAAAPKPDCHSTVSGDLHVESFQSTTFGDKQTLRIWLPPGYNDAGNAKRVYPVLYMLDGENLFDVCTSDFQAEWKIDETLTQLIGEGKVEPLIVVGIDSSATRRADELLTSGDPIFDPGLEPHGAQYPKLLTGEVLPHIEKEFRVKTGRANTAIGGSSYGALAVINALLTRPGVFGIGLVESAALQVGNGEMLRRTQDIFMPPLRIYVGVGTDEAGLEADDIRQLGFDPAEMNAAMLHGAEKLRDNMKASKFVVTPGAHHEDKAWAARFPEAIQFLFPPSSKH